MGIFFLRCSRSFLFDMGHISFRTAFVIDDEVPKEEARRVNCHFSSLHENPVKGWREGADPRGHRHRLGCRARTRPPAIAIGSARIGQASTLSDHRGSRWQAVSRAATCLGQSASRIEIVFERVVRPSRRVLCQCDRIHTLRAAELAQRPIEARAVGKQSVEPQQVWTKSFEDRDGVREGCAPLSTRSRVVLLCSKSFACLPDIA